MSLFYMDVRTLNRSKQSAVAAAAYRSGDSLYSERDMETKNYRHRDVQPETFILAPNNAPDWVYNREKLWNEVEKIETNINSRLAREIKIALPIELNNDIQKELLSEYVQRNFVDDGMVADVSIHRDKKNNPHAHIMLTVRPFDENGNWGLKKKKEYIKDEQGNKVLDLKGKPKYKTISLTNWDKKDSLLNWRKDLADTINRYYEREGITEQISHESYEKQGINRTPKQRLSIEEYHYEQARRKQAEREHKLYKPKTYYAKINQDIETLNKAEKLRKEKVVQLNEYKKVISTPERKTFEEIRKINNLSIDDQMALRNVSKHLRGYVTLDNAFKNIENMKHFERNVKKMYYQAVGINDLMERAKSEYRVKPRRVLTFGLNPKMFNAEIQVLKREYNQKLNEYSKTDSYFEKYQKESYEVLEIQKNFVEKEFDYLYPEINVSLENMLHDNLDEDYAVRIKNQYVEQYRKSGVLVKSIPEFSIKNKKLLKRFNRMLEFQSKAKNIQGDLTVLKRTVNKRKKEYISALQKFTSGLEVKTAATNYLSVYNQYKDMQTESIEFNKHFDHLIADIYPGQENIAVNELPINDKINLIDMNINGKGSGDFTRDSKAAKERGTNSQKPSENNQGNKQHNDDKSMENNSISKGIGKAINNLTEQLTKDENEQDQKRKRKKNKTKAKYRDLDEENQR